MTHQKPRIPFGFIQTWHLSFVDKQLCDCVPVMASCIGHSCWHAPHSTTRQVHSMMHPAFMGVKARNLCTCRGQSLNRLRGSAIQVSSPQAVYDPLHAFELTLYLRRNVRSRGHLLTRSHVLSFEQGCLAFGGGRRPDNFQHVGHQDGR